MVGMEGMGGVMRENREPCTFGMLAQILGGSGMVLELGYHRL